ncbi:MAG: 6-hydroxymethylpterin diphosphokinase MptE-like protein [Lachnospiraceae bacterium]
MIREYKKLKGKFRRVKKRAAKRLTRKFPRLAYLRKCALAKWYTIFGSVQETLFVFKAYEGKAYAGMPRQIYESMLEDPEYADCKFAWLFEKKGAYKYLNKNERTRVYAAGSKKGMQAAGHAYYYITNDELAFYQQFRKTQIVVCALETQEARAEFEEEQAREKEQSVLSEEETAELYEESEEEETETAHSMHRILQRADYVFVPSQEQQAEVDANCHACGNRKVAIVTAPVAWIPSTFVNRKVGSADGPIKRRLRRHTWVFELLKNINQAGYQVRAVKKKCLMCIKETAKAVDLRFLRVYYTVSGVFRRHGILFGKNAKRLHSYRGKYAGKRCFLIGNGPSLTTEDLEKLQGEITFGCNRVYQLFPETTWRPDFFCMIDALIAKYSSQELAGAVECPLFTNINTRDLMKYRPQDLVFARNLGEPTYRVSSDFESYYVPSGATVMTFMLELAMYMGFTEIYLIGVDCTSSLSAHGHCTQGYVNQDLVEKDIERVRKRLNDPTLTADQVAAYYYDKSTYSYRVIAEYANAHGIHIYNATRGGRLEVYERKTLEEVLTPQKKSSGAAMRMEYEAAFSHRRIQSMTVESPQ